MYEGYRKKISLIALETIRFGLQSYSAATCVQNDFYATM